MREIKELKGYYYHYGSVEKHVIYCHREEAEKMLNRKLKDTEVVHHIDHNKKNNSWDNLMVFATCADHSAFHKGKQAVQLEDGSWKCIDVGIRRCTICGNICSRQAMLCYECYNNNRESRKPDKKKLLELLLKYPMIKIGELYGVSDNAVRKWCRSYDLPFKRNDIKKLREQYAA